MSLTNTLETTIECEKPGFLSWIGNKLKEATSNHVRLTTFGMTLGAYALLQLVSHATLPKKYDSLFDFTTTNAVAAETSLEANEKKWVPFRKDTASVQEAQGIDRKLKAESAQLREEKYHSELNIKVKFPGATLSRPDDNGLLGGNYDVLTFQGSKKLMAYNINGSLRPEKLGEPNLPFVRLQVRIPYSVNEKDLEIKVVNTYYRELDGEYDIAPIQQQLPESFRRIGQDTRVFQRSRVYDKHMYFSHNLEWEMFIIHGIKVVEIGFSPLKYNPRTKRIKACSSAEIILDYIKGPGKEPLPSKLFNEVVERNTFNGISGDGNSSELFNTSSIGTFRGRTELGTIATVGAKFVIVSHSTLIDTNTFKDYISYRENQGYEHLETINTDYFLYDEPIEIRNRLLELYNNTMFEYLLIIGDETLVPIPTYDNSEFWPYYFYHYQDYSRLDGTDNMPDVFMGLFLAGNETALLNIFNHQKWQEKGGPWSNDVMMMWAIEHKGESPDYVGNPDIADVFASSHYSTLIMDNPDVGLGYNVHRIYAFRDFIAIPTRYGGDYPGVPLAEFEPWTLDPDPFYIDNSEAIDAVIDKWNEGVAVIGQRAHGSTTYTGPPYIWYYIFSDSITSDSSPLFTSLTCETGDFKGKHSSNIAYQSQVNTFGTCTTFAATSYTYIWANDRLHMFIYDAMFPDDSGPALRNVGQIFLTGLLGIKNNDWELTYYHIFGDPLTNLSLTTSTLNLIPRWNLVSLPKVPHNTSLTSVLKPIEGNYNAVRTYDKSTETWCLYSPNGSSSTLNTIEHGKGYQIHMEGKAFLPIRGEPISYAASKIHLHKGLNMVGYNSVFPKPVEEALASINGKYSSVWAYDSNTEKWLHYFPGKPAFLNNLKLLKPCEGYWIYTNQNCIWDVSSNAP